MFQKNFDLRKKVRNTARRNIFDIFKKRRVSSNQKTLDKMNKRRKLTMDDEFSDLMNTDETSDRHCVKRKLDVSYDRLRMKRTNISLSVILPY